jgi:hypothetical protein
MFTAFAAGAYLVVTGSIGWNVSAMHGVSRWVDAPIWWQVALGVGFLLLGAYWSRRLGEPAWTFTRTPPDRIIKNVGRGKTSAAQQRQEHRSLAGGEPKR